MLRVAVVIGMLLIVVSVLSAQLSETTSVTMWIPAMLGGAVLVGVGVARRWQRTCGVWIIRLVALGGLGACVWRLSKANFDVSTLAHQAQAATAVLCLVLLLRTLRA